MADDRPRDLIGQAIEARSMEAHDREMVVRPSRPTRRLFIGGFVGVLGLAAAGCNPAPRDKPDDRTSSPQRPRAAVPSASMIVYRDAGCGCCEEWAERAREAGFQVRVTNNTDMPAVKRQYGVPEELASCHTALVAGYVLEGHVPLEDVARLLKGRPANIRGIAVPGMPRGSPGMEMPDGSKDDFQVMAFERGGRISEFRV